MIRALIIFKKSKKQRIHWWKGGGRGVRRKFFTPPVVFPDFSHEFAGWRGEKEIESAIGRQI